MDDLRGNVRAGGMHPLEKLRSLDGERENVRRLPSVQVVEIRAKRRLDVDGNLHVVDRSRSAWKREGPCVERAEVEVGTHSLQGADRDPPVRRELPSGDAQHPPGSDRIDGLATCADALSLTGRQDAKAGVRRRHGRGAS